MIHDSDIINPKCNPFSNPNMMDKILHPEKYPIETAREKKADDNQKLKDKKIIKDLKIRRKTGLSDEDFDIYSALIVNWGLVDSLTIKVLKNIKEILKMGKGGYFEGSYGVGKTLFMVKTLIRLAQERYNRKDEGNYIYWVYSDLASKLYKHRADIDYFEFLIRELVDCPILAIDEFAQSTMSPFELTWFTKICSVRLHKKLPIFITSNVSLERLKDVPDYGRLFDRLSQMVYPIDVKGNSYRIMEGVRVNQEIDELINKQK